MKSRTIPDTLTIRFGVPRKNSAVRLKIPTSFIMLTGLMISFSLAVVATQASPSIPVTLDLKPETLNLKSKGNWIQAKIGNYAYYFGYYGFDVGDIGNVELWVTEINGVSVAPYQIDPLGYEKKKPTSSGMIAIKLDRGNVISGIRSALSNNGVSLPAQVTLQLRFTADGTTFVGEDTIKAQSPPH